MERFIPHRPRARGFTLLEVALIVAIIGMMMLMIVGYLMAPKSVPLPPVEAPKLIPGAATPVPGAKPVSSATPAPTATPAKTIDLSPGSAPAFR